MYTEEDSQGKDLNTLTLLFHKRTSRVSTDHTRDQNKQLLNAFRTAVQERGAAVEQELGMNEENLRHALFARNGIPERLALRLQAVTGVELVTKEQIEQRKLQSEVEQQRRTIKELRAQIRKKATKAMKSIMKKPGMK